MEQVSPSDLSGEAGLSPATQDSSREANFVRAVFSALSGNKGLAARLRRADNPATEYQAWDFLASFGIDLEKDYERLPYATIAAAICKSKQTDNGETRLGQALAIAYEKDKNREKEGAGDARLLRLLACDDLAELCAILRPMLSLLSSKCPLPLDYAGLLKQLRFYGLHRQRIRAQWAQDFYHVPDTKGKKS